MICERFEELPGGNILRHRELQTELAEWVEVGPRCWERRVRKWRGE